MKTELNIKKQLAGLLKKRPVRVSLLLVLILFPFYMAFMNYTEPTEIGIARNMISGEIWIQDKGGFHITPPWVWIACVDTRPMRVAITSAGRGYSAKLVQFNKEAWRDFIATEGWHYYWFYNRVSFNLGYEEEYRGLRDIMRGYAYSAKEYPFIVVLEEYRAK